MANVKKNTLVLLGAIILNFSGAYSQSYDYRYPNANYSYDYGYPYNSNYSYNYPDSDRDSRYSYPSRDQESTQSLNYRSNRSKPGSAFPDMNDWDYHESWRDHRRSFFSGETQPEAIRKAQPYGEGGIGYDPDPLYLKMKEEYAQLKRENAEAERRLAEADRRALAAAKTHTPNGTNDQSNAYLVRRGGGQSQKGKASQRNTYQPNVSQRGGGGSRQHSFTNYQDYPDYPYGCDPYCNGGYWYY